MENGWTERIRELEAEVAKLTVEMDKLEEENATLKEYRTAEGRRRVELYAAKVDENHCLKKENEAVRADLTHWKSAWDTENGAVKKLERELDEAMRVIERLKDDAEWAIQTEIGRQHGCKVSIMEHLESIMNRAKAALAGKEGEDYKAANASIREELRCRIKERDKLEAENERLRRDFNAKHDCP